MREDLVPDDPYARRLGSSAALYLRLEMLISRCSIFLDYASFELRYPIDDPLRSFGRGRLTDNRHSFRLRVVRRLETKVLVNAVDGSVYCQCCRRFGKQAVMRARKANIDVY